MYRQIRHLARLIDDLLDVSRITRGKIELRKEVVDVAPIVKGAVETVQPLLEARKHELLVSVTPGALWLEADPTRLEQILLNLLNNAAKYTDNGGRISISAELAGKDVVIEVRDTGIGISPEKLPQMFELFAQGNPTLARSEGGLGIGLTLARSLAEMHGGTVSAASGGPDQGSEFAVRLPAATKPAPRSGEQQRNRSQRLNLRVLVVDDNPDMAHALARLVKLLGHDVHVAQDGPTGLEAARSYRPDTVLLDVGLPGVNGYDVARQLRCEGCTKEARIIAITGYGREEDRTRCFEAGFDSHLVKPVELSELLSLL
jgi:CheY-like chemotaxis protein